MYKVTEFIKGHNWFIGSKKEAIEKVNECLLLMKAAGIPNAGKMVTIERIEK